MGGKGRVDPTFDPLKTNLIRPKAQASIGEVNARGSLRTLLIIDTFDIT